MLRRFPMFGVFGDGQYKLQPIFVDDVAALAVEKGNSNTNEMINAIGPETFTYRELVETMAEIILDKKRTMISIPDWFGLTGRLLYCGYVTQGGGEYTLPWAMMLRPSRAVVFRNLKIAAP